MKLTYQEVLFIFELPPLEKKAFCHSTAFYCRSLKCYLGKVELDAFTVHINTVERYKFPHGDVEMCLARSAC